MEDLKLQEASSGSKKIQHVKLTLVQANEFDNHVALHSDAQMGMGFLLGFVDDKAKQKMVKKPIKSLKQAIGRLKMFKFMIDYRFVQEWKECDRYSVFKYEFSCQPGKITLDELKEKICGCMQLYDGLNSIKILQAK